MQMRAIARRKFVVVTGPESSGSMLAARIVSQVFGIQDFNDNIGAGCSDNGQDKVLHVSLPSGSSYQYADFEKLARENQDYDIYFMICTRDITISEKSRIRRFHKTRKLVQDQSKEAGKIIGRLMMGGHNTFIWSYETFMYLPKSYLHQLYDFLGVQSDFIPPIEDGNKKYTRSMPWPRMVSLLYTAVKWIVRFGTSRT